MNIFVTDLDPVIAAQNLDDKRVIKMILESAQMLSTAITLCGGKGPYKLTHANHPCSIWARTSNANYYWLLNHFLALCDEYSIRYGKIHKCNNLYPELSLGAALIPVGDLTPFANCTPYKAPLEKHFGGVIGCYRVTMNEKWRNDKRSPTWRQRIKPTW